MGTKTTPHSKLSVESDESLNIFMTRTVPKKKRGKSENISSIRSISNVMCTKRTI